MSHSESFCYNLQVTTTKETGKKLRTKENNIRQSEWNAEDKLKNEEMEMAVKNVPLLFVICIHKYCERCSNAYLWYVDDRSGAERWTRPFF